MPPINKKQWFDLPDSLTKTEDGKSEYYNVEGRFRDHPVINVAKSRIMRHNVYEWSITFETRIKRAAADAPAVKNLHSTPIRFDKGSELQQTEFERALAAIRRGWDAWQHYQKFREAPVTDAERQALQIITDQPAPQTLMVDTGSGLKPVKLDDDEERDEDDDDTDSETAAGNGAGSSGKQASAPAPSKPKKAARTSVPSAGRKRKAA
jgi:hypothetical protein